MSSSDYWPRPPRLVGSSDPVECVRWHLRLAVICTEGAKASSLALKLGVTPNIIHLAIHRGHCTDDLAKRIEKLYGREYFPRELFTPEPRLPVE